MEEKKETIKKIIEEILEKMTTKGRVEIYEETEGTRFVIRTQEAGILIGENGQNLAALSHVIKKIVDARVKDLEGLPFSFDVNDYQLKKIEELRNIAKMNAQRVRYFKKEVVMPPMNSYERRIIHSALSEYPDVITESTGEGESRRVVIKPYE
jgi:spoIIIJ-associated protein